MDAIIIRCKSCQHTMKFTAEKAGKKAKCSKCGALVVIEAEDESAEPDAPVVAAAPAVTAPPEVTAPAAPVDPFADDGPAEYGVFIDPELAALEQKRQEEEEAAKKKRKDKKNLPKVARKIKAIPDAEAWDKVRLGLLFLFFGTCAWIATHLLQGAYVLIGTVELPEYAALLANTVETRVGADLPPPGNFWDVDQFDIYMGMIAGRTYSGFAKVCLTVATLLYFVQALCWGIGYALFLPVPRRNGMFGHVLAMIGLLIFNGLVVLIFKLLPILGVMNYIMIPYVVPEIAMTEYNMERAIPINVLWSGAPFWENFLCVLFRFTQYLEPAMVCIFLWSAGVVIKSDEMAEEGRGRARMCLGTLFVLVAFHLLSVCGATPVLVMVLRVFYILWYFFLIMFMLQYVMFLLKARQVLDDKIRPKHELTSGDEDEEEAGRAAAKPKPKPSDQNGAKKKKSKSRSLLGDGPRATACRSP